MRLLVIAVLSVILFFPLYTILHPVFGKFWGSWIAAFMMVIGFPILFLNKWENEWKGPVVKICNYIIAFAVLAISIWFIYIAITRDGDIVNAIRAFMVYGYAALYYIFVGRFHIDLKK